MPRLNNEKHELYCRHRAGGMAPNKAKIAAGYAAGSGQQTELEKKPEIVARIEELLEELRAKREANRIAAREAGKIIGQMTGASKAWVIQQLAENARNAAHDGAYKESNDALKLIGEELGMFKGGSADGVAAGETDHIIDQDVLDVLAPEQTPPTDVEFEVINPGAEPEDPETSEAALRLIEGHTPKRRRADGTLGDSEANIVFENGKEFVEDEDDPDEDDDAEFTDIDPLS